MLNNFSKEYLQKKVNKKQHPYFKFLRLSLRFWHKILIATSFLLIYVFLSGISIGILYPIAKKILIVSEDVNYINEPIYPQVKDITINFFHNLKKEGLEKSFDNTKKEFENFLNANSPLEILKAVIFVALILFLIKAIVDYIHRILFADIEQNIIKLYQEKLFKHYSIMSLNFFHRFRIGELTSRITGDVNLIGYSAIGALIELVRSLLLGIFYLSIALFINWKLTLIAFIFIPIMAMISKWMTKRIKKYIGRSQETWAEVASKIQEVCTNIKVVLSFHTFKRENEEFSILVHKLKKANFKRQAIQSLTRPISDYINMCIALALIWIGGNMVIGANSDFSPAAFFVYLGAVLSMMHPVKVVVNKWNEMQSAFVGLERVYTILDIEPEITDSENAVELSSFKNEIVFDNVFFSYEDGEDVLNGLSFTIKKGEIIAFVGKSGVGKTTILDLLLRFYSPNSGNIYIDGVNIKDIKLSSLRNLISSVTQEVLLFYDTIKNNIAYTKPDASLEEILKASVAANADEFINGLTKKYDTMVGERGTKVSGGQRQRIAIARAILQNPDILIFDEATSSLDTESEKKVQISINNILKDRTAFIVAHRLSTIKNAKKIFVIEKGKIVESGDHKELYSQMGVYRKLYDENQFD